MSADPVIIAGLGNPGSQYANNRHNAGFLIVDRLIDELGGSSVPRKKWEAEIFDATYDGGETSFPVYLIKPQTFMNLSGKALAPAAQFYKVPAARLLVVHDEIELAPGKVQLKQGGGHKGHNGIRDIIARFGTPDFYRLRIGLGRPQGRDVAGYSLSNFSADERTVLDDMAREAIKLTRQWLDGLT